MTDTTEAVARLIAEARATPELAEGMTLNGDEVAALIALAAERDTLAARVKQLEAENARLRIALADAIRRPMGVVPASAEGFVSTAELDAAETRRPRLTQKDQTNG
jgi:hypothetical protein